MNTWIDIVWFVIWAAVILIGLGIITWIVVAAVTVRSVRNFNKDFDRGFDSDFFTKRQR